MIPYIIVYVAVLILTYAAEKKANKNQMKMCFFLLSLIVIILSFFAGLRTVNLGYDTQTYVLNTYKWASSGLNLPGIFAKYGLEKGFITYVYILCKINNNFNFVLFFLNLPVNLIFIYYMYYNRSKRSMPLMITIFYCTLYAFSFNIVRQSLTVSLFLLILIFIDKKKYLSAIIAFVIGCYIHNSMIFSIYTLLIIKFDKYKKISKKSKTLLNIIMIFSIIFIIVFYKDVIQFVYNLGMIPEKFLNYINTESSDYRGNIDIEYSLLFLKTSIVILTMIYYNTKNIEKEKKNENKKWVIMLLVDYVITFLSFKLANTDRISWYLYYPAIFMYSSDLKYIFKKGKNNFNIGNIIVSAIFIAYLLEKLITNQYRICPYEWIF